MSSLTAHIGENSQFKISRKGNDFFVNDEKIELNIVQTSEGKYHLLMKNQSYSASLVESDHTTKIFTFKINGRLYLVKLEDQFDQLLQKLGMDVVADKGFTELKAPMPGKVLSISIGNGDFVKEGEHLLILEAMKMENVLKSPTDLTVKTVQVKEGQAVEKNELLIEFEH